MVTPTPLPPGSQWQSRNRGCHPPSVAVVERMTAGGSVVFLEAHRARARTGRGRSARRQNLPAAVFLRRYGPLRPGEPAR